MTHEADATYGLNRLSGELLENIQQFVGEDLGLVYYLRDDMGMSNEADDVYNVAENYYLARWEMENEAPDKEAYSDAASVLSSVESFDQEQIENNHSQICEWCSPFHPDSCTGTRMCREQAAYFEAQTGARLTYVCTRMPRHRPRYLSMQQRIVSLVLLSRHYPSDNAETRGTNS